MNKPQVVIVTDQPTKHYGSLSDIEIICTLGNNGRNETRINWSNTSLLVLRHPVPCWHVSREIEKYLKMFEGMKNNFGERAADYDFPILIHTKYSEAIDNHIQENDYGGRVHCLDQKDDLQERLKDFL
jgi:hypothetical protein